MATTAFPVRQDSGGVGTTDVQLRNIIKYLYPTRGIVGGLTVTGGTAMRYQVAGGLAVCSKGASDGNTLAYFEGGETDEVSANSASNPRIDVVWITSHDVTQGDSDNLVTLGVTVGTAAATPTEPTIPTYATKLASMLVPAGSTTTAGCTQYGTADYVIPYAASLGVLHSYLDTRNGVVFNQQVWLTQDTAVIDLPTDRIVQIHYSKCMGRTSENVATTTYVKFKVDGVVVDSAELGIPTTNWTSYVRDAYVQIPAGTHTITIQDYVRYGSITVHYGYNSSTDMLFPGLEVKIIDIGPVI